LLQTISSIKSSFILPCKSWTDARFGISQFVTPNTHVHRHFGVESRKQKTVLFTLREIFKTKVNTDPNSFPISFKRFYA
jgi:hypothetical protein